MRAVHEGMVAFAGQFTGYGNLVIVEHGERRLLALRPSERAAASQRETGSRPRRRARPVRPQPQRQPRAVLRVRVDGKPVDPLQWLRSSLNQGLNHMTFKTRLSVLLLSTPVLAFVLVGGLMGNARGPGSRRVLPAPAGLRRRGRAGHEQLRRRGAGRQGDGRRDARASPTASTRTARSSTAAQVKAVEAGDAAPGRRRRHRADAPLLPATSSRRATARRPQKAGLQTGDYDPRDRRQADARHVGVRRHARSCAASRARRSR